MFAKIEDLLETSFMADSICIKFKHQTKELLQFFFNIQYMRNSPILYRVKMESVSEINIFWPKNNGEKWSRFF